MIVTIPLAVLATMVAGTLFFSAGLADSGHLLCAGYAGVYGVDVRFSAGDRPPNYRWHKGLVRYPKRGDGCDT